MKKIIYLICFSLFLIGCGNQASNNSKEKIQSELKEAKNEEQEKSMVSLKKIEESAIKTYEGPFGLAMGISIEELSSRLAYAKGHDLTKNMYLVKPPKSTPIFNEYAVYATKEDGLCQIIATAKVPIVNSTGDQIKSKVDEIAETVSLKYGKFTKKNFYYGEDVYKRNSKFFMLGLAKGSILYGYEWVNGKSFNLPNDLEEILIYASPDGLSEASAVLIYNFKNNKICIDREKKENSKNL